MKKLLAVCLNIFLIFSAHAVDTRFDTMVIFGDSLSDNGNLYRYMLHFLPVSPPYYEGHFSNGLLWTEYLYDSYFSNHKGFQDYAVGGAGAVLSRKENLPFTLSVELNDYLYWHTYDKRETSLYTIWIGANNYINGPSNVEELTTGVVNAIGAAVERLIEKGGNKFLVANLPDLGRVPQAQSMVNPWLLTELTVTHNRKLAASMEALKIKYPNAKIILFDVYTLFNETLDRALDYSFTNINEPCYAGSYSGWLLALEPDDEALYDYLKGQNPAMTSDQWLMIKDNPQLHEAAFASYVYSKLPAYIKDAPLQCESYVFWDKVHPTSAVHKIIAESARALIDEAGLEPIMPGESTINEEIKWKNQ